MRRATIRAIALSLPETEERETWQTATFRVRNKIFAMFAGEEREIWIKTTHDEQRALVEMDPEAFFVPPYVGPSGWVGARVARVERDEVRELLIEAWRMTAPKRSVRTFDGGSERTSEG